MLGHSAGAHPWKAEEQGLSFLSFSISRLKHKKLPEILKGKGKA
jgi:hypothetical protein|nr:hypothetical protein [uncultured Dialister sp.]